MHDSELSMMIMSSQAHNKLDDQLDDFHGVPSLAVSQGTCMYVGDTPAAERLDWRHQNSRS